MDTTLLHSIILLLAWLTYFALHSLLASLRIRYWVATRCSRCMPVYHQWRNKKTTVEAQEHFQLSPFHHYVRHPWYFLAILIIWTRSMEVIMLTSAITITLYLIISSHLEEHKLIRYHGNIYRRYMKKIPGIFPLPWKYLHTGETL